MSTIAQLLNVAFNEAPAPDRPADKPRRRARVWELPTRWHCPLVGTCLPVVEMRKIAARAGFDEREMSDYTLHTTVVGNCDSRNGLTEAVQKYLDKRYAAALTRFARIKGEAAVLAAWQEARTVGNDIAGALWAAWSHADITEDGGKSIHGDIHMLSHQVGAAARADLRQLERLKQDNAALGKEAEALRQGLAETKRQKDGLIAGLRRQLADAEQRAALLARRELELAEARRQAGDYETLFKRAETMGRRIETLEERNAANARRAGELELALADTRTELTATDAALEMALGIGEQGGCGGVSGTTGCGKTCPAEVRLAGRCVLCIGGRANLVEGYRRLVETQGGRFLHHDGGQEESLHRIDAAVGGADAVVCQAGCVSHAAYYRLKEACKKLGKPCVFVQSPGIGSFARGLVTLASTPGGDQPLMFQPSRSD
jgi:hypothetical protein